MELRPVEMSCEKNYGRIRFLNEELVSNNWVARTSISYHTHIAGSTVFVSRQQNRDGIPVFLDYIELGSTTEHQSIMAVTVKKM